MENGRISEEEYICNSLFPVCMCSYVVVVIEINANKLLHIAVSSLSDDRRYDNSLYHGEASTVIATVTFVLNSYEILRTYLTDVSLLNI